MQKLVFVCVCVCVGGSAWRVRKNWGLAGVGKGAGSGGLVEQKQQAGVVLFHPAAEDARPEILRQPGETVLGCCPGQPLLRLQAVEHRVEKQLQVGLEVPLLQAGGELGQASAHGGQQAVVHSVVPVPTDCCDVGEQGGQSGLVAGQLGELGHNVDTAVTPLPRLASLAGWSVAAMGQN